MEVILKHEELKKSIFLSVNPEGDMKSEDSVSLSQFLCSVGLCCESKLENSTEGCNLQISHLPPLVVQLDSTWQFTCLVSHVADEMHFYVHPVQENLAHDMNYIDGELCNHYSVEDNCIRIPSEDLKCGSVCCVYSVNIQQWCRGVITSLKSEFFGEAPKCLVFFFDYGESEWVELAKVFTLIKSLSGYPCQVMCCCLEEVSNSDETGEILKNPDLESFTNQNYFCSMRAVSECVGMMKRVTEGKKLFVAVKGEGKLM